MKVSPSVVLSILALGLGTVTAPTSSAVGPVTTASPAGGNGGSSVPPQSAGVTAPGRAAVRLTGLPKTLTVKGTVSGPRGFRRTVTLRGATITALTGLRAGVYTLRVPTAGTPSALYYPTAPSRRVTVVGGKTAMAEVRYALAFLTFSGAGPLRLGMTWAQALTVDPATKSTDHDAVACRLVHSSFGDVWFNSATDGGGLSFIWVRKNVPTAQGVRLGDPYAKVRGIYGFTRTTLSSDGWDFIAVSPDYLKLRGKEADKAPYIGIDFTRGKPAKDTMSESILTGKVNNLFVDGGQRCFN